MNWERLRTQLMPILQADVRIETMTSGQWAAISGELSQLSLRSVECEGKLYFPIVQDGDSVQLLTTSPPLMTEAERRLVELVIESYRPGEKKQRPKNERELFLADVRDWIEEMIAAGLLEEQEPPAKLASSPSLYATKIPFLIYGEYHNSEKNDYAELKKLLETFFDGEIVLVPLKDKEWLILANDSLLADADEEDGEESIEEKLASLCYGVQSVILNEGAGECHVSVYYPMIPIRSLPLTVSKLREAIATGRLQRVEQYIHLPWELYLDQLLSPLSQTDRLRFIEQVFKRKEPVLDNETIQTLETFFELDCNVSETAKRLFIHRNTLLYRLDKFKQDSGLDVRTFNQAVHVKIALQLYKVTKRQ